MVMGVDDSNPESYERLAKNYSDRTGETRQLADGPIKIAAAVLVAGYIASIPSEQQPIVGMIQEFSRQLSEGIDRVEQARLSTLADPIVQRFSHGTCGAGIVQNSLAPGLRLEQVKKNPKLAESVRRR